MNITLYNGSLEAVIQSTGAEITALRRSADGKEYIWNGGKDVWNYHAPILFPAVGRTLDGFYTYRGRKYEMGIHGFIRDMEHRLISRTQTSADWEAAWTEETLARYPWKFSFRTHYELTAEGIIFTTEAVNMDSEPMLFALGTHCAFTVDTEGMKDGRYRIEFERDEPGLRICEAADGYIRAGGDRNEPLSQPYALQDGRTIPLGAGGLGAGMILTGFRSETASLCSKTEGTIIRIRTEGFPYLVLWQNSGEPRFVCIEPWHGLPDTGNTDHDWASKPGLRILQPGQSFMCDQSITLG